MAPRLKRIYEPPAADDGARFLVDRLWPRGVSKERAELTAWLKVLAPSDELRREFHQASESDSAWQAFQAAYFAQLDAGGTDTAAALRELDSALSAGPVTLLFAAHNEQCNNAVALAEWLARHKPV
ncbi:MAG: DUF488 domain-containing protein [Novosphingobium sp.]